MKIKQEHFEEMKTLINAFLDKYGTEKAVSMYETGKFHNSANTKDLQMRFCFDLYHGISSQLTNRLNYLNDDHIFTALKAICPKVIRKY